MKSPKVSIIIPCYNAERFMALCLQSVLNQTLTDIEIICVDDGSTDSTLQILRDFEQKDNRVSVLTQQNQYAGVARNFGMTKATGEYLYFLDSDDFIEPVMLQKVVAKCEQDNADICVFNSNTYNLALKKIEKGQVVNKKQLPQEKFPFSKDDIPNLVLQIVSVQPWNKVFRASFVKQHNLRFQELKRANDTFFSVAAAALAKNITVMDYPFHNRHRNSTTSLQETRGTSDSLFYALKATETFLIENNLYNQIQKSFMRLVIANCRTVNMTKTKEDYIKVGDFFKNTFIPQFELTSKKTLQQSTEYQINVIMYIASGAYKNPIELKLRQDETTITNRDPSLDFPLDDSLKISVIIPILEDFTNNENIWQCINTVLRQTLVDIEIICVVDKTKNIQVDNQQDERVKIIEIEPKLESESTDYAAAWNKGINKAKGEFLFFLEPNDTINWRALEHLYRQAKYHKLILVSCQSLPFFEPMELFRECENQQKQSFIVNRMFLKNHQIKVRQTKTIYEIDLLMAEVLAKTLKWSTLNEPLHNYRVSLQTRHGVSKTEQLYNLYTLIVRIRMLIKQNELQKTKQKLGTLTSSINFYANWLAKIYKTMSEEELTSQEIIQGLTVEKQISKIKKNGDIKQKIKIKKGKSTKKRFSIKRIFVNLKKGTKKKIQNIALKSPFFYGLAYAFHRKTGHKLY
ncbi:MAG: glycosyltransferase [Firmicutes bacterium]|nr:glycosyltransferase [Bacillota bacterium]